jgi:hypothetical protein
MIEIIVNDAGPTFLCNLKFYVLETNMTNIDRVVRLLLAIVFIALYFTNVIQGFAGMALLVAGSMFFLNNFTGFCLTYWLLGYKSHPQADR